MATKEEEELNRIRHEKMKKMVSQETKKSLPGNGEPIHIASVDKFKEILEKYKDVPIVIDFWAEWCGPCRMLTPVFKKAAEKFKEKVLFLKINTEELPSIARYFQVSSIPDVILIHKQEVKAVWIGARPLEFYMESLEKYLKALD